VDIASLRSKNRKEIGQFFSGLTCPVVAKDGKRLFMITDLLVQRNSCKVLTETPSESPQSIGRIDARELYNKYRPFFETKYREKMKQTDEYGAKTYAAEETAKEIRKNENIVVTKRRILDAMKTRENKSYEVRVNDALK